MVFDAFGIRDDQQLFGSVEHEWLWRGTRRRVEVLFQNIREITDDALFEARDDQWKLIIDFPFDTGSYSPTDDQARVREVEAAGGQAQTLCWLPHFLSQGAQKNLGKLVVLEEILKSEDSFNRYSRHLSPQDRASARTLLDNQRSQLRQQLKDILMGAYGVAQPLPGSLDNTDLLESQLMSLQPGFRPRPPQGTTMAKAFEQLLGQALAFQYPEHPEFESEVRLTDLGKIFTELRRAIHAPHGRIDVDTPLRPLMRQIAQPLKLGEMHERHFIFKDDWPQHLARAMAQGASRSSSGPSGGSPAPAQADPGSETAPDSAGESRADAGIGLGARAGKSSSLSVRALRAAMDEPRPRGLPTAVQNLLILIFAEHGQYAFSLHGGPYEDVPLKDIRDDLVLTKQALAEHETWQRALSHAGAVLGLTVNELRTANNQSALQKEVHAEIDARLEDCRTLVADLMQQLSALGLAATGNRLANAKLAVQWLEALQCREGPALVEALAELEPVTSLQALGRSVISAARVSHALADNNWDLLRAVWDEGEGTRIKRAVADALAADELVTSLADALKQAQRDATRLIQRQPPVDPPADPPADPPLSPEPQKGKRVLKQDNHRGLGAGEARRVLKEIEPLLKEGVTLDINYQILGDGDD